MSGGVSPGCGVVPSPTEVLEGTSSEITGFSWLAENVPADMRVRDQWVAWSYEKRKASKPAKPLISPYTMRKGSHSKPRDWAPFSDAVDAILAHFDRVEGLGFVFSRDDPYTGVDFDNCIFEGEIDPEVWETVLALDSYTEVSPSGRGLKVFCRAPRMDYGAKADGTDSQGIKVGDTEIYFAERYFTLTGNCIHSPGVINDSTEAVASLFEKLRRDKPQKAKKEPSKEEMVTAGATVPTLSGLHLSDEEVIIKAKKSRRHATFNDLYYNGDTSGYPSHSEADMALMRMLYFWSGGDLEQAKRIFTSSALYRPEEKGPHYLEYTIQAVSAGYQGDVYDPVGASRKALEFIEANLAPLLFTPLWRGVSGATDRDVYKALLVRATEVGYLSDGIPRVSMAMRDIELACGISLKAVQRSIPRLMNGGLLTLVEKGKANRASLYSLPLPSYSSNPNVTNHTPPTPVNINVVIWGNAASLELLRLRWSGKEETIFGRLGKTAGWILDLILNSSGKGLSYDDMVIATGMRKDKVKVQVKKLIEAGLVRPETVPLGKDHIPQDSVFVLDELAHQRLRDQLEYDGSIGAEEKQRKRVMQERQGQLDRFLDSLTPERPGL